MRNILEINNLKIVFESENGRVEAVRDFSFNIYKGEIFALVGESGSGKSVCAHSVTALMESAGAVIESGSIKLDSNELVDISADDMRKIRGGRIAYIFQEPMVSLNPLHNVISQITERLILVDKMHESEAEVRAEKLLREVGIREIENRLKHYPHQFSGGERQRVMIAMALAGDPDLLIADEPTTALDVTVQKQILELVKRLSAERDMSVLLITHDLGIVRKYAERVAVVREGLVVESGITEDIFNSPKEAYTQRLLAGSSEGKSSFATDELLLNVKDFHVSYTNGGLRGKYEVHAVKGVGFQLMKGESLGIVGESGSGKSSLARGILKLTEGRGEVMLKETDIMSLSAKKMREIRSLIQIVFQDPYGSLNPRMTVAMIVSEGLSASGVKDKKLINERLMKVINDVGLNPDTLNRYPHEFSGGQRQRIAIARALILKPEIIIFDEATSSLDRTVQIQIIDLLKDLQEKYGFSYIVISHDLSVIKSLCHRVAVMKNGEIVETGKTESIFNCPKDDYTSELLAAACYY